MEDVENLPPERRRDRIRRLARKAVTVPLAVRTSDLPKRAASGVVLLLVLALALFSGNTGWPIFVGVVALGVWWEWTALARRFTSSAGALAGWAIAGALYIGAAAYMLVWLYHQFTALGVLMLMGGVIATDVGAYFTGRALGGPKIAPRVSPSKTWAGLFGGMAFSGAWFAFVMWFIGSAASAMATAPGRQLELWQVGAAALVGAGIALTAQAGDFFESWMKRRAGVKDSGKLIPGHGGLFDRLDGVLAVALLGFPFMLTALD